ncbi:MAG: hypothetical protein MPN21_14040 [Thermoanaerobaculia bacterium]|nr:hypothetical protein [Thermoanaerobaculia bacterium]
MSTDNDLDQMIRETLRQDESELLQRMEEPSLRTMMGDAFSSRLRWLMVLSSLLVFVSFLFAVWAGVHFFQATETEQMIRWGALMFLFLMPTSFIKIFHWLEMERSAIVREIKRVELRLVQLAEEWGSEQRA